MGQVAGPDERGQVLLGAGASTLAAAFASAARRHFEEGVLWLRVGDTGHLPSLQRTLAQALGFAEQFASIEQGRARLRDMFSARNMLLVLDDVWTGEQLAALDVIDAPGRLLYTAADAGAAPESGVDDVALITIPPLTDEQAATLLAQRAQRNSASWSPAERAQVDRLTSCCDRLPFGITLAGTLARAHSLAQVLEFLDESNNDQRIFSRLRPSPGLRELDAVYRNLDKRMKTDYRELGVLPPTEPLSVPALSVLWQRALEPTAYILRDMADRGLLIAGPGDTHCLHTLQQRYVAARDNDPEARHDRLADSFLYDGHGRPRSGAAAPLPLSISQRAYWLRNGPYHLSHADKFGHLRQLLTDVGWLREKLEHDGPMAVADALARYQQTVESDRHAGLARAAEVVRMVGEVLADDPGQLPAQLIGRLNASNNAPPNASGDVGADPLNALLGSARAYRQEAWLRPVRPTLAAPAGVAYATRQAHSQRITAVAWFGHEGDEFALSAALDGRLYCWTATGQLHAEMRAQGASGISAMAVDGHRTLVAIGATDGAIELWNPVEKERVQLLSAPTREPRRGVGALAISPDGQYLVSGSQAGEVALWALPSGQFLGVLGSHSRAITDLAITSDSGTAVSASDDGSLKVWDLASQRPVRRLWYRTKRTRSVALGPDDNLALAVSAEGRLDFWHLGEKRPIHSKRCLGGKGRTVTVSADGTWALAGAESAWLAVLDVPTRSVVGRLWSHTRGVNAVAMDRAGRRAISGADDQTIKFWHLYRSAPSIQSSVQPPVQSPVHTGPVHALAIPDNGDFAVSQGVDGDLAIWDLDTGEMRGSCPGASVRRARFYCTPDGRYAFTSSGDHHLSAWRLPGGQRHALLTGAESSLVCAGASDDGAYAIAAARDGAVLLWPLTAGRPAPVQRWQVSQSWQQQVAVSADGQRVLVHNQVGLRIFASDSGREVLNHERESASPGAFTTTRDGRRVVLTSGQSALIFDIATGDHIAELAGQGGHAGPLAGLAVTERHAIALSGDGRLRVWSLESGELVHTLSGDAFGIRVLLGVTGDGARALSQSRSGTIEVWDLDRGKRAHALSHRVQILDWASDPSGDGRLLTGARDGRLILWNLASGRRIATFKADGPMRACALALHRQRVAAGDELGRVHILEPVDPGRVTQMV